VQFSQLKLLSANKQPIADLDADRQDMDLVGSGIDAIEDPEAILRSESQLPSGAE